MTMLSHSHHSAIDPYVISLPWGALVLIMIIAGGVLPVASDAQAQTFDTERASSRATATSGECLVKFQHEGPHALTVCPHCLLAKRHGRRAFQTASTDRSGSLYDLFERIGTSRVTPAFRSEAQETSLRAQQSRGDSMTVDTLRKDAQRRRALQQRPPATGVAAVELFHVYRVQFSTSMSAEDACAQFRNDPHVEYCQPNYIVSASFVPNDPYYTSSRSWGQPYEDLWGLKKMRLATAWNTTQGRRTDGTPVVVAVVDTGIDYTHPDLAANVWMNPGEIPNNGVDDDHNGYADDVRGWDLTQCAHFGFGDCLRPKAPDNDAMDGSGHGTHVAGTIAAIGNNHLGIIGVAPQAQVMPVKSLNDEGEGAVADLAAGIVYAAENGANVINNSWGCGAPCPPNPIAEDAVRSAQALGAVVVFAAGNSADNVANYSPQNMTDHKPIVVAATTQNDRAVFFTNFGALVDVAAPGGGDQTGPPADKPYSNVLSLRSSQCTTTALCGSQIVVGGQYVRLAGTSMAAPHVSGAAALVLARHPSFSPEEVRQVLRASAGDAGTLQPDQPIGTGRVDAAKALTVKTVPQMSITAPSLSTGVTPFDGTVPVTGTASGDGFRQYRLSYGAGSMPTTWTPIGLSSTSPVEHAVLGNWDVSGLHDGAYTLQLVVTSRSNLRFDVSSPVFVERYPALPITAIPSFQGDAAIVDNRVAWLDARNYPPHQDIFSCVYDPVTKTCPEQRITTDDAKPSRPAISGNWIVWADSRSGNSDVYAYDLAMGQEIPVVVGPASQGQVAISGDLVVWADDRNGKPDIYLYDLARKIERPITANPGTQGIPSIDGTRIAWWDLRRAPARDLYYCDYNRETGACPEHRLPLPRSAVPGGPVVAGDRIVWTESRNGTNDIYSYDLATHDEQGIAVGAGDQVGPKISGDHLIWMDVHNQARTIYYYDFSTTTVRRILSLDVGASEPAVSGDRIVWSDARRDHDHDVYLYAFPVQTISGTVADASGQPVAGVPIDVILKPSDAESQSKPVGVTTDAQGRYVVTGLLPGSFKVTARVTPALRAQGIKNVVDATTPQLLHRYRWVDLAPNRDQTRIDFLAKR